MLYPVGPLPASVYWRRRLLVLAVLVGLVAGGGWLAVRLLDRPVAGSTRTAPADATRPVPTPALEQVLGSLASVRTPGTAPGTPPPDEARSIGTTAAAPVPGGPCTDAMLELAMRAPNRVPVGGTATLEIVVRNVAAVPCVRQLGGRLSEVLILDAAGTRVWGSDDCQAVQGERSATLAPGETVALPVAWDGLGSGPGCGVGRTAPPAGVYVLRGRLDTATTPDRRMRLV